MNFFDLSSSRDAKSCQQHALGHVATTEAPGICPINIRYYLTNNMVEITVNQNLEKAMRVLKRKLIREGVFKELKARRFYEKPSEKRKRKEKESFKKKRKVPDNFKRLT